MRSVSPELAAAIEARERTVRLNLNVDWDGEGHGAANTGPDMIADTFSRDVVAGWGAADTGQAWTTTANGNLNYSVGTGQGKHSLNAVNSTWRSQVDIGSISSDQCATVSTPVAATGASIRAALLARYVDVNNYYWAACSFEVGGTLNAIIVKRSGGTETTLASVAIAGGYTVGTLYRMRFQVFGTAYQLKVWPASGAEPAAWTATATDTTGPSGTVVGPMSRLTTGNTNALPVVVGFAAVRIVTGNVDDLSDKAGSFSRQHTLTGGLPDEVRIVEGSAAAECDVDLAAGASDDEQLSAVRYFSRFNPASPLYGKERMFRDVTASVEFLTSNGWQSVPRMRGLTQALPVSAADRTAHLRVLDYRQRLRRQVRLPAVPASTPRDEANQTSTTASPGLESTWVASYALAQCGIYASPPPRPGCRLWAPMHGSAYPVVADVSGVTACDVEDSATFTQHWPVTFQPGPFVLGTGTVPSGRHMYLEYVTTHNQPASRLIRADGHTILRVECWAKASGSNAFEMVISNRGGSTTSRMWIDGSSRLSWAYSDGTNSRTITGPVVSGAYDGQWHFFGGYINTVTGQAVFRVDGTSTSVAVTALTPPAWTTIDEVYDAKIFPARAGTALAELHVSAGGGATDLWLNEMTWTAGAHIDRLQNRLAGVDRTAAQEAWQLLSELLAAEAGTVYCDEDGVVQVASLARLVSAQAQTVQRTITSSTAITDLAYDDKADTVRNVISCPYSPVEQHNNEIIWSSTEKITIIPHGGLVRVLATLDGSPTTRLSIDLAANTLPDGTGAVVVDGSANALVVGQDTTVGTSPIVVRIDSYEPGVPVPITVINRHTVPVFLVDTSGGSKLRIRTNYLKAGAGGSAEYRHEASIAAYGEQPLSLSGSPWRQTESAAAGAAMLAGLNLGWPQQPLSNLAIVADPRLQFYDRIRVQDLAGTQLDADYWITGSREQLGDGYTMSLSARQARNRFVAGSGLVGVDLVG